MRIGHYTPGIWAKGGVASYIRRISQEQRRLGHEIFYFDLVSSQHLSEDANDPPEAVADEAALFRRAAEERLDILHVHMGLSENARPSVPTIRTVHGHQPYCPSGSRFLKRQGTPCNRNYSAAGCAWGHLVDRCGSVRPAQFAADFRNTENEMRTLRDIPAVTVSHFLKQQMVRAGYREDMIHVLHLPAPEVKATALRPHDGTPRFVFLGRITPLKGVAWLLRAVKKVPVPINLDIAGEGHEEPEMRRLTAQLGLDDRVTFHGWMNPDQVNTLLSQSRALVFPSVWHEPGGTAAFEAMVNRRAVIMSRVGGMPEVISEGVNGLLVEPNDVAGLAHAMECLAEDWQLATRLGEAGRQMALDAFSLQSHVEALTKLYVFFAASNSENASSVQ